MRKETVGDSVTILHDAVLIAFPNGTVHLVTPRLHRLFGMKRDGRRPMLVICTNRALYEPLSKSLHLLCDPRPDKRRILTIPDGGVVKLHFKDGIIRYNIEAYSGTVKVNISGSVG